MGVETVHKLWNGGKEEVIVNPINPFLVQVTVPI